MTDKYNKKVEFILPNGLRQVGYYSKENGKRVDTRFFEQPEGGGRPTRVDWQKDVWEVKRDMVGEDGTEQITGYNPQTGEKSVIHARRDANNWMHIIDQQPQRGWFGDLANVVGREAVVGGSMWPFIPHLKAATGMGALNVGATAGQALSDAGARFSDETGAPINNVLDPALLGLQSVGQDISELAGDILPPQITGNPLYRTTAAAIGENQDVARGEQAKQFGISPSLLHAIQQNTGGENPQYRQMIEKAAQMAADGRLPNSPNIELDRQDREEQSRLTKFINMFDRSKKAAEIFNDIFGEEGDLSQYPAWYNNFLGSSGEAAAMVASGGKHAAKVVPATMGLGNSVLQLLKAAGLVDETSESQEQYQQGQNAALIATLGTTLGQDLLGKGAAAATNAANHFAKNLNNEITNVDENPLVIQALRNLNDQGYEQSLSLVETGGADGAIALRSLLAGSGGGELQDVADVLATNQKTLNQNARKMGGDLNAVITNAKAQPRTPNAPTSETMATEAVEANRKRVQNEFNQRYDELKQGLDSTGMTRQQQQRLRDAVSNAVDKGDKQLDSTVREWQDFIGKGKKKPPTLGQVIERRKALRRKIEQKLAGQKPLGDNVIGGYKQILKTIDAELEEMVPSLKDINDDYRKNYADVFYNPEVQKRLSRFNRTGMTDGQGNVNIHAYDAMRRASGDNVAALDRRVSDELTAYVRSASSGAERGKRLLQVLTGENNRHLFLDGDKARPLMKELTSRARKDIDEQLDIISKHLQDAADAKSAVNSPEFLLKIEGNGQARALREAFIGAYGKDDGTALLHSIMIKNATSRPSPIKYLRNSKTQEAYATIFDKDQMSALNSLALLLDNAEKFSLHLITPKKSHMFAKRGTITDLEDELRREFGTSLASLASTTKALVIKTQGGPYLLSTLLTRFFGAQNIKDTLKVMMTEVGKDTKQSRKLAGALAGTNSADSIGRQYAINLFRNLRASGGSELRREQDETEGKKTAKRMDKARESIIQSRNQ